MQYSCDSIFIRALLNSEAHIEARQSLGGFSEMRRTLWGGSEMCDKVRQWGVKIGQK